MSIRHLLALLAAVCAVGTGPAEAVVCTVPGTHPTIESAVDDVACTEIELAIQNYAESLDLRRSLVVTGAAGGGTLLQGQTLISGAATQVTMTDIAIDTACPTALRVSAGAQLGGGPIDVVRTSASICPPLPGPIFADGFENGDTSRR